MILILTLACLSQVNQTESDPAGRLRDEMPAALKQLESVLSQAQAEARLVERQGEFQSEYQVRLWIDGPRQRCDLVWAKEFAGHPQGYEQMFVQNEANGFELARDPDSKSKPMIRSLGPPGEEYESGVGYYARRHLHAPIGLDRPLTTLMEEPSFRFEAVTALEREGRRLIRADFRITPTRPLPIFIQPVWTAKSVKGWVIFDPEARWAIQEMEVTAEMTNGQTMTRLNRVEYAPIEGDPAQAVPLPRKVVQTWNTTDRDPATITLEFDAIRLEPTPADQFTLAAFGLGDLATPGGAGGNEWLWVVAALALVGIVAILVVTRSRRRNTATA